MTFPESAARSEERLWRLIEARTRPGADKRTIDAQIWDLFGEEWSVMFTDLSGFSRHVAAFGIIHFLQVIHEHKKLLLPIVESRSGILVKAEADSLLILFKRASAAMECALEMQHACRAANVGRAEEEQMRLCVGLGSGAILRIGDREVYGAEVNAASKLGEDIARADEILVTESFRRALDEGVTHGVTFEPLDVDVPGTDKSWRAAYVARP